MNPSTLPGAWAYTQVRLKSLIGKYRERYGEPPGAEAVPWGRLVEPALKTLVLAMGEYEGAIERAAAAYEPALLSRYLLELADAFNAFYSGGERIVGDDAELSKARIAVCCALLQVLGGGLEILGVPRPDRM